MDSRQNETAMGKLTIVTPPSMVTPKNLSFTLINLDNDQKNIFTDSLNELFPQNEITVFIWDKSKKDDKWLAEANLNSDYVVKGDEDIKQQIETIKARYDRRKFSL